MPVHDAKFTRSVHITVEVNPREVATYQGTTSGIWLPEKWPVTGGAELSEADKVTLLRLTDALAI